jgi:hypothetical protein
MAKTNAERQRAYKERQKSNPATKESFAEKNRRCVAKHRASDKYKKETKESARLRKQLFRLKKKLQTEEPDLKSTYQHESSLHRAVNKAEKHLPGTPRRNKVVVRHLAEKVKLKFSKPTAARPKPHNAIADDVKTQIREFYLRDDISRWCPGKRDTIAVWDKDRVKTTMQRRYLILATAEVYACFKEEFPNIRVGETMFRKLRPMHVLYASETPRNTCLCTLHENMKLLFDSANRHSKKGEVRIPLFTSAVLSEFVCDTPSHACYYNECSDCKDAQLFVAKYPLDKITPSPFGDESDSDVVDESSDEDEVASESSQSTSGAANIQWYQWIVEPLPSGKGDHAVKSPMTGTLGKLYNQLKDDLPEMIKHDMVKIVQSQACKQSRVSVGGEQGMLQIDFAENYNCGWQDAIARAHWGKIVLTLFTSVAYYEDQVKSTVIVSDNLNHDKHSIVPFVIKLLSQFPDNVTQIEIWSDGPSSQFKNRFMLGILPMIQDLSGKQITWNYFAAMHGKGPVDGVGGTIKRHVHNTVSIKKAAVQCPESFMDAAKSCKGITCYAMATTEIDEFGKKYDLKAIFSSCKYIYGVKAMHKVSVTDGTVFCNLYDGSETTEVNLSAGAPKPPSTAAAVDAGTSSANKRRVQETAAAVEARTGAANKRRVQETAAAVEAGTGAANKRRVQETAAAVEPGTGAANKRSVQETAAAVDAGTGAANKRSVQETASAVEAGTGAANKRRVQETAAAVEAGTGAANKRRVQETAAAVEAGTGAANKRRVQETASAVEARTGAANKRRVQETAAAVEAGTGAANKRRVQETAAAVEAGTGAANKRSVQETAAAREDEASVDFKLVRKTAAAGEDSVTVGNWVAVEYAGSVYPGQVKDIKCLAVKVPTFLITVISLGL